MANHLSVRMAWHDNRWNGQICNNPTAISITPDGKPREDLFIADRLHFNEQGYKLLADRVRPVLPAPAAK